MGLIAWGSRIYLLTHQFASARTTVSFYERDGSKKGEVGRHVGVGRPKSLRLTRAHGYFLQHGSLFRVPLDGEGAAAEIVSERFAQVFAIHGKYAYGVRCAAKQDAKKRDELVRLALEGGDPQVLTTIERSTKTCHYGDIAVQGDSVFVTEWEGGRLLSLEKKGGEVRVLAEGHAFAKTIYPRSDHVDFSCRDGMMRVPRAGGKPEKLTEVGSTPFCNVAEHQGDYWVFQGLEYESPEYIWHLPKGADEARKIMAFGNEDIAAGAGIRGLAVDDQCFYYARHSFRAQLTTIFAHPKRAQR